MCERVLCVSVCASIWTKKESEIICFEISSLTIRFIYFIATTGQFGQIYHRKSVPDEKKENSLFKPPRLVITGLLRSLLLSGKSISILTAHDG